MIKFLIIIVIVGVVGGFIFLNSQKKSINPQVQNVYKIVAFGDSITAGYGVDKIDSYSSVLGSRLQEKNPNITVINMGVSGETTTGGLKRVESVLDEKPDIVLLGLGGNDMLRSVNPEVIKSNLEAIIVKLQEQKIKIVLMGMKSAIHNSVDYREKFNKIYPDLSEKYNLILVSYFLEGVALKADLNLDDRIHPNKAGYEKIVDKNILPVIEDMFK